MVDLSFPLGQADARREKGMSGGVKEAGQGCLEGGLHMSILNAVTVRQLELGTIYCFHG